MAKKSYIQKLNDDKDLPKFVELDESIQERFGGKTMVIVKPTDIYEIMKSIPKGKLITTIEIRQTLAKKYKVDVVCPLTTGIFLNICANASLELQDNLPYHRTLKAKGELNIKYPNAYAEQIALLEAEGFEIIEKGRKNIKYFVKDYDKYLMEI